MSEWADNAKRIIGAMIAHQAKELADDERPSMAFMNVAMIADLRKESEEQALAWLKANPKAEDQGNGLWLVRL